MGGNIKVTEEDKKMAVQVAKSPRSSEEGEVDADLSASWCWESGEDDEGDEDVEGAMDEHDGFAVVVPKEK